ncbi:hypothetical protein C4D60_Mb10t07890 [Musa balbisiana]|uniref:Uncharacterized protein n=1 Tax=Musa balbisiana TaxID=52838 RepID=A0A4S8IVK3_MUSBA|nr:hypothetical protein C4D60_Mb10t07890 [Musa balbisiana]
MAKLTDNTGLGLEPRSSRRGRLFAATWVDVAGERRPSPPATPTDKRTLPTVRSGRAGGRAAVIGWAARTAGSRTRSLSLATCPLVDSRTVGFGERTRWVPRFSRARLVHPRIILTVDPINQKM